MRPCRAVVNQGCIRTRLSRFRDFKTLCTSCSEVKPGLKLVNHITTRAGYLHTRLLFHKPSDGFGMCFGFGCTPDFSQTFRWLWHGFWFWLHTKLLFHKPSDGFGMGFGWATDVGQAAQTRERSTIGPNSPRITFPRLLEKNNNWNSNLSQNQRVLPIFQTLLSEVNFTFSLFPRA